MLLETGLDAYLLSNDVHDRLYSTYILYTYICAFQSSLLVNGVLGDVMP